MNERCNVGCIMDTKLTWGKTEEIKENWPFLNQLVQQYSPRMPELRVEECEQVNAKNQVLVRQSDIAISSAITCENSEADIGGGTAHNAPYDVTSAVSVSLGINAIILETPEKEPVEVLSKDKAPIIEGNFVIHDTVSDKQITVLEILNERQARQLNLYAAIMLQLEDSMQLSRNSLDRKTAEIPMTKKGQINTALTYNHTNVSEKIHEYNLLNHKVAGKIMPQMKAEGLEIASKWKRTEKTVANRNEDNRIIRYSNQHPSESEEIQRWAVTSIHLTNELSTTEQKLFQLRLRKYIKNIESRTLSSSRFLQTVGSNFSQTFVGKEAEADVKEQFEGHSEISETFKMRKNTNFLQTVGSGSSEHHFEEGKENLVLKEVKEQYEENEYACDAWKLLDSGVRSNTSAALPFPPTNDSQNLTEESSLIDEIRMMLAEMLPNVEDTIELLQSTEYSGNVVPAHVAAVRGAEDKERIVTLTMTDTIVTDTVSRGKEDQRLIGLPPTATSVCVSSTGLDIPGASPAGAPLTDYLADKMTDLEDKMSVPSVQSSTSETQSAAFSICQSGGGREQLIDTTSQLSTDADACVSCPHFTGLDLEQFIEGDLPDMSQPSGGETYVLPVVTTELELLTRVYDPASHVLSGPDDEANIGLSAFVSMADEETTATHRHSNWSKLKHVCSRCSEVANQHCIDMVHTDCSEEILANTARERQKGNVRSVKDRKSESYKPDDKEKNVIALTEDQMEQLQTMTVYNCSMITLNNPLVVTAQLPILQNQSELEGDACAHPGRCESDFDSKLATVQEDHETNFDSKLSIVGKSVQSQYTDGYPRSFPTDAETKDIPVCSQTSNTSVLSDDSGNLGYISAEEDLEDGCCITDRMHLTSDNGDEVQQISFKLGKNMDNQFSGTGRSSLSMTQLKVKAHHVSAELVHVQQCLADCEREEEMPSPRTPCGSSAPVWQPDSSRAPPAHTLNTGSCVTPSSMLPWCTSPTGHHLDCSLPSIVLQPGSNVTHSDYASSFNAVHIPPYALQPCCPTPSSVGRPVLIQPSCALQPGQIPEFEVIIIGRVTTDSLLVGWNVPYDLAVKSFRMYVDQVPKQSIHSGSRTTAVIHQVNLSAIFAITICAIGQHGLCIAIGRTKYAPLPLKSIN